MTALWFCHRAKCGNQGGRSLLGEHGVLRAEAEGASANRAKQGGAAAAAKAANPASLLQQLASTRSASRAGAAAQQPAFSRGRPPPLAPQHFDKDLRPLSPEFVSWFASRGIGRATLEANGIAMETRYNPAKREPTDWVAFPYRQDGAVVNVKYRAMPKSWRQSRGGSKIVYGYDDVKVRARRAGGRFYTL
jgi:hypothetical protein